MAEVKMFYNSKPSKDKLFIIFLYYVAEISRSSKTIPYIFSFSTMSCEL